jgi:acyl-coenzyme A thioesterase PaaI-like protein
LIQSDNTDFERKQQSMRIKQPNSHMCFLCGVENPVGLKLKIYAIGPGLVETSFTAPEHFQGYPGVLHGGIVATILDEVSGRALMGDDPTHPRFMFTAKLEIRYRKNVPIGQSLRIQGRAGKTKGRLAEGCAGIYDQKGNLLAEGNSLLMDIPKETYGEVNYESLGWKVYPD